MKDAFDWFIMKKLLHEELLWKDRSVSIHHKSIQTLVTEMYKVKNELPQVIVSSILCLKMQSQYKSLQESGPAIHLVRIL